MIGALERQIFSDRVGALVQPLERRNGGHVVTERPAHRRSVPPRIIVRSGKHGTRRGQHVPATIQVGFGPKWWLKMKDSARLARKRQDVMQKLYGNPTNPE